MAETREQDMEVEVPLEWVQVVGRFRRELGDVGSLAHSIKDIGLINPITVTADGRLVAGQRRLEAVRQIGMTTIPARIVESLDGAVERLTAERDENTERKDMTPEELVALGRALEELERPKAEQRAREARTRAGKIRQGTYASTEAASGSAEPNAAVSGKTNEKVAEAIGTSATTYMRAKTVVEAANDHTTSPEERAVAQAALDEMNTTGRISGAYEKVRKARDARLGAPQKSTLQRAAQQRKVITNAAHTLSGMAHGLAQIDPIHPDITDEEAAQWLDGLSEARRVIESLIKRLRAHSQGGA